MDLQDIPRFFPPPTNVDATLDQVQNDAETRCIDCGGALRRTDIMQECDDCGGCLVAEEDLLSTYLQVRDDVHLSALPLVAADSTDEPRPCPVCSNSMVCVLLEDVEIDYCQDHGFWFDPNEFQQVLDSASESTGDLSRASFWHGVLEVFLSFEHRDTARGARRKEDDPWFWLRHRK